MTTLPILSGPTAAPPDAVPAGAPSGTPDSGAAFAALVDLNLEPQEPEQAQPEQPAAEPQPALPWSGLLIASAPVQQVVVEAAAGGPVDVDGGVPLPGVPVAPLSGGATIETAVADASRLSGVPVDAAAQPPAGDQTRSTPTAVVTTTAAGPVHVLGGGNGPTVPVQQAAVTSQVFPEVARLVTRGDGTHRITFRLTPDNLGEVRIVLTVRDGAVQVAMTASAAAQEALRSGSHELHRLLESVGASSSQIKVSDAASTANTTISTSGADAQDGFTQPGSDGAGRHDQASDHHAWMREGTTSARDGGRPGAASLPDPTNPDTSRPASGVDVTM